MQSPFRRIGLAAALAIALSPSVLVLTPLHVAAAPAPTVSRYLATVDYTTLLNEGCAAAPTPGYYILSFGEPWYQGGTYGAYDYANQFVSIAQITAGIKGWLTGYHACSPVGFAHVAVGTSNDFGYTGNAHGQAWATMINALNAWLATPPSYLNVEAAMGGIDAETEWATPSTTEAWAQGYAAKYTCTNWCTDYVDFGDAGGCPATYTGTNSACNGSPVKWHYSDVQYMAWKALPAFPLPIIYYYPPNLGSRVNANQWEAVSLYSGQYQGAYMFPVASLTQFAASGNNPNTNNPGQGWSELQGAMNSNSHTAATLYFSTDITWAN